MKTKLFFTLATLCFAITANAQKPFKEIGKDDEVDILTLSNGRYIEYFTYDTLRQIGSVVFNTKTHKVQFFVAKDDSTRQQVMARAKEASRFMSVDPSAKKYPSWSPYLYAGNSPIRFIDIEGKGPGDVVVAFGGGDWQETGDKGRATSIIQKVNEQNINKYGGKSQSFASSFWGTDVYDAQTLDIATQAAYDFIKANYNKVDGKEVAGGKIVIQGYSMGGVLANYLATRLEKEDIKVALLVTVDEAAAWKTSDVDRSIPANVEKNLNIYQTTPSPFPIRSHGGANTAEDPSKTSVINVNVTKFAVHSDIDDLSEDVVVKRMAENLNTTNNAVQNQAGSTAPTENKPK